MCVCVYCVLKHIVCVEVWQNQVFFSFYLVDSRGQTQVTRFGTKYSPVKINMSTKVESVEKKHSSQRDGGWENGMLMKIIKIHYINILNCQNKKKNFKKWYAQKEKQPRISHLSTLMTLIKQKTLWKLVNYGKDWVVQEKMHLKEYKEHLFGKGSDV